MHDKTPISMQDPKRNIYVKEKSEKLLPSHWTAGASVGNRGVGNGRMLNRNAGSSFATMPQSGPSRIGLINLDVKQTGTRSAGNPHATCDVAGVGNVAMVAGLRSKAKAMELPPTPTVRAPAPDPTNVAGAGNVTTAAGLRSIAKAMELPPTPTVRAPALDPTDERDVETEYGPDNEAVRRETGKE